MKSFSRRRAALAAWQCGGVACGASSMAYNQCSILFNIPQHDSIKMGLLALALMFAFRRTSWARRRGDGRWRKSGDGDDVLAGDNAAHFFVRARLTSDRKSRHNLFCDMTIFHLFCFSVLSFCIYN